VSYSIATLRSGVEIRRGCLDESKSSSSMPSHPPLGIVRLTPNVQPAAFRASDDCKVWFARPLCDAGTG